MKPNPNLKGNQGHKVESNKPFNQSLQNGSENISSMSNNGPLRHYYGALEMNLKTCTKGTKMRVYTWFCLYEQKFVISSKSYTNRRSLNLD